MATRVHLPDDLLAHIDRRAAELKLSRTRYIVTVLARSLEEVAAWSQTFLDALHAATADTDSHQAVDDLRETIHAHRSSKNEKYVLDTNTLPRLMRGAGRYAGHGSPTTVARVKQLKPEN